MSIQKLTLNDVEKLKNKHIYFVKYLKNYLDEYLLKFPELPMPEGILDDCKALQGVCRYKEYELTVKGYDSVRELPDDSAIIITTGYYAEEYEALCEIGIPDTVGESVYYLANQDTEYYEAYRAKYAGMPLQDTILFRSGPGTRSYVYGQDFGDNARSLFEHMLEHGYNKKYELIWLVKYPELFKEIEEAYDNVHFYSYDWSVSEKIEEREIYYRALCLAKYMFFTDSCAFCRYPREGQVRIQLWHGCGLKTRKNFPKCENMYEFMTVNSPVYAKNHKEMFRLREDQLLVTGQPKHDELFHPIPKWQEILGIPQTEHYIFWLPTFRTATGVLAALDETAITTQTGLPLIYSMDELQMLNETLKTLHTVLVIKLHPIQTTDQIFTGTYSNIVLLENRLLVDKRIRINQLLGHADALISDYSSVAIDYLLLDRPIAFTLDDIEEYEKSRGFEFTPIRDWLPGQELYTFEDFTKFIVDVMANVEPKREKRRALTEKFHAYRDDKSCERIIEALHI